MWSAALGVVLVVVGVGVLVKVALFMLLALFGGCGCSWLAFLLNRPRLRRRSLCIFCWCTRGDFGVGGVGVGD